MTTDGSVYALNITGGQPGSQTDGTVLIKVRQEDVHLAMFCALACKDNVLHTVDTSVSIESLMMVQVMQASFGPTLRALANAAQQLPLLAANPMDACTALLWPASFRNTIVLAQRGNCTFATKVCLPIYPPNHKD